MFRPLIRRTCLALAAAAALATPLQAQTAAPAPTVYKVWFLGGQSNMEGFGFTAELPAALRGPVPGVMIFNGQALSDGQAGGGLGLWAPLSPGFGTGFSTDGRRNSLSERFGPELTFGRRLAERGAGRIVTVCSVNAFFEPDGGVVDYGAAKAAMSCSCRSTCPRVSCVAAISANT